MKRSYDHTTGKAEPELAKWEEHKEEEGAKQGQRTWLSLVARGFGAAFRAVALGAVAAMPCALRTGTADDEEEAPEPVAEEEDEEDPSDLASDPGLICLPCCCGTTLLLARVCCFSGCRALDPACEGTE